MFIQMQLSHPNPSLDFPTLNFTLQTLTLTIICNKIVRDTHIVGKISLPQKHWDNIIQDQILLYTYWMSLISDCFLVWDIYILETKTNNVGLTLTLTLQTLTLTLKWKCLK